MKVIICGAGQVGWQIARHLANEKNDVTVVDRNYDLVRRATDTLDVQGIVGFASYIQSVCKASAAAKQPQAWGLACAYFPFLPSFPFDLSTHLSQKVCPQGNRSVGV